MAYGEGRSLLYRDMGQESSFERGRYEREVSAAEDAYSEDAKKSSLYETVFGTGAAIATLFATGSPTAASAAYGLGKGTGRLTHKLVGKAKGTEYKSEDYAVSTDPGKFNVDQKYFFEDVNRRFEEAEESRFWKDITGTGTSIASILALGAEDETGMDLWNKYMKQNQGLGQPVFPNYT